METGACVCLCRLHASALFCWRMDAAVKTSKCEAQINDIGRGTIKESNRVMKIREGGAGEGGGHIVLSQTSYSKPIA